MNRSDSVRNASVPPSRLEGHAGRWRAWWRAAVRLARYPVRVTAVVAATGCYTYTPLLSPPAPGSRIEVTLSDRGRQATSDSLGPAADRIEGTVRSRSDSAMLLAVSSVRYFTGQTSRWGGEPLNLNLSSLRTMRERRFSRSRTTLVAGGVAALLVGFIASRTLGADDDIIDDPSRPPPPVDQ